ncbi:MAG: radical SAM protein, partial [Candidatus Eremiobacteraeota bacterium]|nr:radical SAM protein [Candidatus Eremiobacteraeota bacterium]
MPFSSEMDPGAVRAALESGASADAQAAQAAVSGGVPSLEAAAALLSPAGSDMLEDLAQIAHRMTVARFGKTIAMYAPLYLSNQCACTCTYCGFSMGLNIRRKTLTRDEISREAVTLAERGFRNILLVSAEHPKYVNVDYVCRSIEEVKKVSPYVGLEIAAADEEQYRAYVASGCDGVVLYQETYDPAIYARHHLGGPKKKYHWRLDALERAGAAGVRHLGVGALLGLADWRFEALALLWHARYLERRCWRSQINVSFPRINPAAGGFVADHPVDDRQLVQLLCLFRLALPTAGIALSTRETPQLR